MSKKFQLTANSKTYDLSTDGSFTEGGRSGSWSVLDDGSFELRPTGSGPENAKVQWKFDAKNHLVVMQGASTVYDFASDPKLEIGLSANVVQVWPDGANNFKFELPFVWSIGANFAKDGKLEAALGGVTSTLSGRADKAGNRFVYRFRRTDGTGPAGAKPTQLAFSGSWKNSDSTAPGTLDVWFEYDLDGTAQKLQFPAGLWNVDANKGTLFLQYGTGPGRQTMEISGDYQLSPSAKLSFSFEHRAIGGTVINTLTFETEFSLGEQKNPAALSLTIKDQKAPGGVRSIEVAGKFSYHSSKFGVTVSFELSKKTGATLPLSVSLAVVVNAKIGAGGSLELTINTLEGGVTTLSLKLSDVQLKNGVSVSAGLNLTVGGKEKYVSGFLAFSW
jgi:hypothetical protein